MTPQLTMLAAPPPPPPPGPRMATPTPPAVAAPPRSTSHDAFSNGPPVASSAAAVHDPSMSHNTTSGTIDATASTAAAATVTTTPSLAIETQHEDIIHDMQMDFYGSKLATCSSGTYFFPSSSSLISRGHSKHTHTQTSFSTVVQSVSIQRPLNRFDLSLCLTVFILFFFIVFLVVGNYVFLDQ